MRVHGKWKDKRLFLAVLCLLYFLFLLRFYICDYFVPDEGLYFSFANQGRKAQDGFSSLFLLFSGFLSVMPRIWNVGCLVLLTLSLFSIGYFYISTFSNGLGGDLIVFATLFGSSIWYYFYGKLFYDFPFAAFSYSLAMLAFGKALQRYRDGKAYGRPWFLLCFLTGFTLSWKLYYVFAAAGLGLLILVYGESRTMVLEILKKCVSVLLSLFAAAAGFAVGNFNIFFYPLETIEGIKAYPAAFRFDQFLLNKGRVIWDHVNDLPFHFSVFHLAGCVLLLFGLPLLVRKYAYLAVSIFMSVCLYLYVTCFSPGYAWHGFAFGMFIITFVLFLCAECKNRCRGFYRVAAIALLLQCGICFGVYIPRQAHWFACTKEAVHVLEEESGEILSRLESMRDGLGQAAYSVDVAVKRSRFVATGPFCMHYPAADNPYCFATNYVFMDVLTSASVMNWQTVWFGDDYESDLSKCAYVFFIMPDCFMELGDVSEIAKYGGWEVEDTERGKGYTIFLYHRKL